MSEFLKKLTRKNVYGTALCGALILIVFYAVFPDWRDGIYIAFFNPLWALVLGWLEFILQENVREEATTNQRKLNNLNGVIRKSLDTAEDKEKLLVEAMVDAVGASDLGAINEEKIKQKKLQEKIDQTKVEQEKPEDLKP